ncbi:MAG: endolytic transglycosylase MltG [Nitrospiraceae bacterium]
MNRRPTLWLVACILCAAGIVGYQAARWTILPLVDPSSSPEPPAVRIIEVSEGTTFRQLSALLENERLIASQWGFEILGRLTWADRRIPAGEYALHAGMRPTEILRQLRNGQVVQYPVTIPEGYTVAQIANLLEQKGLADKAEFLGLARDSNFIRTLGLDLSSLEGYLFPNTYHVPRRATSKDIISAMVTDLWQAFTPAFRARARDVNMSIHQVLTLASVIERETSVDGERELISAVFHNRLRRKIPLQSDPTVIYGLKHYDGNLRKRDLAVASPYNTYRVRGLPPGPIANPGARSIRAALFPAPTTFLYFVSRNDGTHVFSSTLDEHNRAVNKYQRRPARRLS